MRTVTTARCAVGRGPAGMPAGLVLARAGVDVTVMDEHRGLIRDFCGTTIRPATLAVQHVTGRFIALGGRPELGHCAGVATREVAGGRR